jgi:NAD-dependent dihydropyrimidine dehydrogenase PreA subunit
MAQDDAYRVLARRLDEIPNGFPPTATGAELRLLAFLFEPEEAALAIHLRLTPEPAADIAARAGQEPAAVHSLLKSMARRGLIRAERARGALRFALLPFVVGIYELQGTRLDAGLAALVDAYFQEAHPGLLAMEPALQRVIPVEEAVPIGVEILPYERASQLLDGAAAWGVVDCLCRQQQRLLGKGCDRPLEVCMVMSETPGAFDEAPTVRALTREEATALLKQAEEAGLVHSTSNSQRGLPYLTYICNCCACCCGILRGIVEFGLGRSVVHAGFCSVVDASRCTGCELCLERCQLGALAVDGGLAQVDRSRCIGCGLCATTCPNDALSLERRPADEAGAVPPDNDAWWAERARNRGLDLGRVL